ncbi:hypothetical protein SAMN03159338_1078 [Sphingomonas sp. NFR04]|uniref:hypothetical protein n=1 Tax=Sphingomonas sp. NFR04 TaxID=1566283 RepID=UPI0008E7710D|nr:hypothetical protein [Sphingomonas sp. NFR04]SFJ20983.1 hypothetical protein SAMN03159338_1078 [Sphingomonas sp. NFR04]
MAKMGIVWERTTAFVGEHLGALVPVALLAFVVPSVLNSCVSAAAVTASPGVRLAVGVVVVLLSIVSFWGSLSVIALATGASGLAGAGQLAARRLPAALLVAIGIGVAAALAMLPVPLILATRGYDVLAIAAGQGATMTIDPQTSSMVALWVLVLILAFFFLFTRLLLVSTVVLREGLLFGAIRRSWALTRGHGWRILGLLLLFTLIGGVAQLAAKLVFGSVFALLFGNAPGLTTAMLLTTIVTASVQAVVMLLLAAFQGKLYVALTATDSVWPA